MQAGRTIATSSGEFYLTYESDKNGNRKWNGTFVELDDNARLIAAAPELLAALRGLLDWCREHTGPTMPNSPHELLCVAHEAIAKAEGRGE